MRILAFPRYGRLGASSRVRFYQFEPWLRSAGFEVVTAPLLDDTHIVRLERGEGPSAAVLLAGFSKRVQTLLSAHRFDLVWIEKELFPWLPEWVERLLACAGIPYVADFDDAWFHRYDRHPRWPVRAALGRKIDKVMRNAALVTAGNRYLAEHAGAAGARWTELVPSVVDAASYPTARHEPANRPLAVVWIGTRTTAPYLRTVAPALRAFCQSAPAELVVVGSDSVDLPGVPVRQIKWTEDSEAEALASCDIGIMPLPDGAWERGKCGYKLIQYMAAGIPVIASPTGANCEIVTPEVGLLADTGSPADWEHALRRLAADRELRRTMGIAGRDRVQKRYALALWGPRLAALLLSAATTRNCGPAQHGSFQASPRIDGDSRTE